MLHQLPPLKESPSQTAGPYVHIGLTPSREGITGANVKDLGSGPIAAPHYADRPHFRWLRGSGDRRRGRALAGRCRRRP
jgi:protocatechuate 3,4-dioxygenase beta subunit